MDKRDRQYLRDGLLVKLHSDKEALKEQCSHADAKGRYVIASDEGWLISDPPTKMQVCIWHDGKPERERRVHWECFECGEIMPLSSYST